MNAAKKLSITATSFGTWWGTDPMEKRQADVDVIAANRQTGQIILGECKWKENVNFQKEREKLINKGYLFSEYTKKHYYLFTKLPPDDEQKYNDTTIATADMMFVI